MPKTSAPAASGVDAAAATRINGGTAAELFGLR
jgi:hypothetical protein